MRLLTVPFIAHKALASSSPAQVDRIFTDMGHPSGTVAGELLEVVTAARALPHYADGFVGLLRAATSLRGRRVELSAADLSRIGAPTLLIWGARDTHGGVRTGRRLVEVMPDARLELCGEGHLPWLDDPAGCGHLVRAFLGA